MGYPQLPSNSIILKSRAILSSAVGNLPQSSGRYKRTFGKPRGQSHEDKSVTDVTQTGVAPGKPELTIQAKGAEFTIRYATVRRAGCPETGLSGSTEACWSNPASSIGVCGLYRIQDTHAGAQSNTNIRSDIAYLITSASQEAGRRGQTSVTRSLRPS